MICGFDAYQCLQKAGDRSGGGEGGGGGGGGEMGLAYAGGRKAHASKIDTGISIPPHALTPPSIRPSRLVNLERADYY